MTHITKFVDIVDSKIREYFPETNLKRIRTVYGITQAELAERSGVSLRSIQMYEQRQQSVEKGGCLILRDNTELAWYHIFNSNCF